jgi:hypothetical protein
MANRLQEQIAVSDYLMPLPFQATDVPDGSVTAKAVQAASDEYVMNYNGCVMGASVRHNADLTGGTITWQVTINGVAQTALSLVTDDTHQQAYGNLAADVITFKAGDRVGLGATKSGTVAPTTTDVAALVNVLYEDVGL